MIDQKTVKHVAEVARLHLEPGEIPGFAKDMESVIGACTKLSEVNTDRVEPSFQPLEISNVTRADKPEECLSRDEALANTRNREEGHFKGPKVV
jgi:aspartyl-tRNA(Asn)/glutamyl-tRNA(Gln) amidotransferase subunit C